MYTISQQHVIPFSTWNVSAWYPKTPEKNSGRMRKVNVISEKASKQLTIESPFLYTWGIEDYKGDKNFKLNLKFPDEEHQNPDSQTFLEKLQAFETSIIDFAVANPVTVFGEQRSE